MSRGRRYANHRASNRAMRRRRATQFQGWRDWVPQEADAATEHPQDAPTNHPQDDTQNDPQNEEENDDER